MRQLRVALLASVWIWGVTPAVASTAVAGQSATATGDDQTLTLPSAVAVGHIACIGAAMANETPTISITGTTMTWVALGTSPYDSPGNTVRIYWWCAQGDGVDNTFTVTTSDTSAAQSAIQEFTGPTSTTADDVQSADDTENTGLPFDLDEVGNALSLSGSTGLLLLAARATTGTTFSAGTVTGGTCTLFGSLANSGFEYCLVTGAGSYNPTVTANSNETSFLVGAAFSDAATPTGGHRLSANGVGN